MNLDDVHQLLDRSYSWAAYAACRGKTDLFYPERNTSERVWREARAICASCPVLDECRQDILQHPNDHGMWAGMTPQERIDYVPDLHLWSEERKLTDIPVCSIAGCRNEVEPGAKYCSLACSRQGQGGQL